MIDAQRSKVALVSGASKGIGLSIAERLYLSGIKVVICSRSQKDLDAAIDEICKKNATIDNTGELYGFCCDATKEKSVIMLVDYIQSTFGCLDILVNNCGGLSNENTGTFCDLSADQWMDCINTNLMSAVLLSKHCHSLLKASMSGRVINVASLVAVQPGFFNPHYAAAKAGLLALSKNLSMVWAEDGILVNAISPGIIETEGWQEYIVHKSLESGEHINDVTKQESERASSNVPLKRMGTVDEVARCVDFLVSDVNSYITGTNLIIDGGKYRAI